MTTSNKAAEKFADYVIALLEQGNCPWKKTWRGYGKAQNFTTKKAYQGVNSMLLNFMAQVHKCPFFATFNQIKNLNGQVVKGAKSIPVVFYTDLYFKKVAGGKDVKINRDEYLKLPESMKKRIPYLTFSLVFSLSETTGIEWQTEVQTTEIDTIEEAEKIRQSIENMVEVEYDNIHEPCFVPGIDTILMPEMGQFESSTGFYEVLFHEGIHATGHKDRLNRDLSTNSKDANYAFEELVAEIGSGMLAEQAGILQEVEENMTAYIGGWLKRFKEDKMFIFKAAQLAHKASKFINENNAEAEETEAEAA